MTGYAASVGETGKVFDELRSGCLTDAFGIRAAGFYRTIVQGAAHTQQLVLQVCAASMQEEIGDLNY